MWQEIVVIILILCAIAGVGWSVHTQRHQRCEGADGCKDCPIAGNCKKQTERTERNKRGVIKSK